MARLERNSQGSFRGLLLIGTLTLVLATGGIAESSLWGRTPETPAPHPDSKGRNGYWWWPKDLKDGETGNRGRVFSVMEPATGLSGDGEKLKPPELIRDGHYSFGINNILFDFDDVRLAPEATAELDRLIAEMKTHIRDTVVCIGHTDDVGGPAYNRKLGERRARAVKEYMVKNGIHADRIGIRSMGESEPAVPNDGDHNRMLNRRVTFDFTPGN